MKAVYFEKHGGLEVLRYGELPAPKAGAGEALVRVKACALNHLDLWVRMGLGVSIPMPHVLGSEIAGTIEAVGADFDPRIHQAVMHEVSADHREGEVMEELRRGYTLGDRLLRPAMVKVAKA